MEIRRQASLSLFFPSLIAPSFYSSSSHHHPPPLLPQIKINRALLHEARKKAVTAATNPEPETPVEAPAPAPAPAEQPGYVIVVMQSPPSFFPPFFL